jgi:hypothetical protein
MEVDPCQLDLFLQLSWRVFHIYIVQSFYISNISTKFSVPLFPFSRQFRLSVPFLKVCFWFQSFIVNYSYFISTKPFLCYWSIEFSVPLFPFPRQFRLSVPFLKVCFWSQSLIINYFIGSCSISRLVQPFSIRVGGDVGVLFLPQFPNIEQRHYEFINKMSGPGLNWTSTDLRRIEAI